MKRKMYLLLFAISLMLIFNAKLIQADDITEIKFTEIYDHAVWGRNEEGIGYSGGGSEVQNAKMYMDFLENFLKTNYIESVVDVGCGDWTFSKYVNWEGVRYIGYDVVKSVIERNVLRFSGPSTRFIYGNAIHLNLPESDLLICKDVLQHLSNDEIFLFLNQIHKFKYCLITNDIDLNTMPICNTPIFDGEYRPLDLTPPPFNVRGVKVLTYQSAVNLKQVLLISN